MAEYETNLLNAVRDRNYVEARGLIGDNPMEKLSTTLQIVFRSEIHGFPFPLAEGVLLKGLLDITLFFCSEMPIDDVLDKCLTDIFTSLKELDVIPMNVVLKSFLESMITSESLSPEKRLCLLRTQFQKMHPEIPLSLWGIEVYLEKAYMRNGTVAISLQDFLNVCDELKIPLEKRRFPDRWHIELLGSHERFAEIWSDFKETNLISYFDQRDKQALETKFMEEGRIKEIGIVSSKFLIFSKLAASWGCELVYFCLGISILFLKDLKKISGDYAIASGSMLIICFSLNLISLCFVDWEILTAVSSAARISALFVFLSKAKIHMAHTWVSVAINILPELFLVSRTVFLRLPRRFQIRCPEWLNRVVIRIRPSESFTRFIMDLLRIGHIILIIIFTFQKYHNPKK